MQGLSKRFCLSHRFYICITTPPKEPSWLDSREISFENQILSRLLQKTLLLEKKRFLNFNRQNIRNFASVDLKSLILLWGPLIFNLFLVPLDNVVFPNYCYVFMFHDMHRFCWLILLYYLCRYLVCIVKTINVVAFLSKVCMV